jgi:hypothetical protein
MTNNETLKKYGLPLFFYVGDTFVNTCGSLVEIVEVKKHNLKVRGPSGTFDYKPLDILKRLVKKDYTSYKQPTNGAMTTQTKKFNLPIDEKISKKLCHYIGVEYSDDLRGVLIYNGKDINKRFDRMSVQNCSMEYIKAVLAELPDVDTTDNNTSNYVSSLNFKERNELLNLAIELKNLEPSKRLKKTIRTIYTVFKSGLYDKLKGKEVEEKAINFLNDRDIKFITTNTIDKAFTYIEVRNLENLKKRIQKLDSSLRFNNTEYNVNEVFSKALYNKLKGHDSIRKTINLLNSWELSPKKETVSTLTPNKQKKFNNWVGNLKEATKKQRLEIKRTFLLSKLSRPSVIEFYNLLEGSNCGTKANILLNKWSIEWEEEEKNSKEFTEGLGKYATTMNPCVEDAYSLLKFKEKRDIKKLDENLLLLLL